MSPIGEIPSSTESLPPVITEVTEREANIKGEKKKIITVKGPKKYAKTQPSKKNYWAQN